MHGQDCTEDSEEHVHEEVRSEETVTPQSQSVPPIHVTQCVTPHIIVPPLQTNCVCRERDNSRTHIWVGIVILALVAGFFMGWLATS